MADRCVNFTIDMTGTRMPVVAACSASGVANDWIEYPSTTSTSTSYTQPSEESDPSGSALNVDQTCCVDSSLPDADIEAVSRPLCTSGFLVAKSIHTTCVLTVKIEKYTRSGNVYRSTMSALLRRTAGKIKITVLVTRHAACRGAATICPPRLRPTQGGHFNSWLTH